MKRNYLEDRKANVNSVLHDSFKRYITRSLIDCNKACINLNDCAPGLYVPSEDEQKQNENNKKSILRQMLDNQMKYQNNNSNDKYNKNGPLNLPYLTSESYREIFEKNKEKAKIYKNELEKQVELI